MSDDQWRAANQPGEIAGFWARIFAAFIDTLVLAAIGTALALLFRGPIQNLHTWGRLVGFGIALLYFSILNSRIGGGQTFGKRIMGLVVVQAQGERIKIGKSIVRFLVLWIPYYCNGLLFRNDPGRAVDTILFFLVFAVGGSILYLYIANRRTRQSVHDLLVGTYVCRVERLGKVTADENKSRSPRSHRNLGDRCSESRSFWPNLVQHERKNPDS